MNQNFDDNNLEINSKAQMEQSLEGSEGEKPLKKKLSVSDIVFICIASFLILMMATTLILNQFVFLSVRVSGESMLPTLQHDDLLIANKIRDFKKGDIVIIEGEKDYLIIKRVVATEDDTVCCKDDGYVYINGEIYEDKFGKAVHTGHNVSEEMDNETYTLKKGEVFYLGDNRVNSSDSRDYGTCSSNQIIGVVENWSIDNEFLNSKFFHAIIFWK